MVYKREFINQNMGFLFNLLIQNGIFVNQNDSRVHHSFSMKFNQYTKDSVTNIYG